MTLPKSISLIWGPCLFNTLCEMTSLMDERVLPPIQFKVLLSPCSLFLFKNWKLTPTNMRISKMKNYWDGMWRRLFKPEKGILLSPGHTQHVITKAFPVRVCAIIMIPQDSGESQSKLQRLRAGQLQTATQLFVWFFLCEKIAFESFSWNKGSIFNQKWKSVH